MSQDQAEYITDAMEMIGVSEPRQIITEVSGFIPVFEVVLHYYKDYMTALVFGRMWQYCNMSDGVCKASLDRIGQDLEISGVTVMRHAEKLVSDGFLIDTTPDRRNAPHEYLDGRKVEMKGRITGGMTINNATVIKSNATVIKSQLIKQDKTNNKQLPPNGDGDNSNSTYGTAYNRGEQERPDKLTAMLDMVSFPGAKESAKLDALLSAYGVAFTVNSETAEWKKLAKHAISEQKTKGWEPAVFIEWVKKQNGFADGFWSARRMLSEYPKAYKPQEQPQENSTSMIRTING